MLIKRFPLWAAVCLVLAFGIRAQAQSVTSGDVTGTITDPTGAAIPGAFVTLTNTGTNTSQATNTNADGSYRFAFIAPGTYRVRATAGGFQAQERTGIVVTAGQPVTANMQLAVAASSETV